LVKCGKNKLFPPRDGIAWVQLYLHSHTVWKWCI